MGEMLRETQLVDPTLIGEPSGVDGNGEWCIGNHWKVVCLVGPACVSSLVSFETRHRSWSLKMLLSEANVKVVFTSLGN